MGVLNARHIENMAPSQDFMSNSYQKKLDAEYAQGQLTAAEHQAEYETAHHREQSAFRNGMWVGAALATAVIIVLSVVALVIVAA